jgi:phosphoglycerate kinase
VSRIRRLRTLAELPVRRGTRVLLRADLNCPLRGGEVAHDFRVRRAAVAVRRLRELGAVTVVVTHLGRPGGAPVPELSLRPVVERLASHLGTRVRLVPLDGPGDLSTRLGDPAPGDVVALENLRFDPGEAACSGDLAATLAGLADVHVNDAFGAAHRRAASTVGVARRLPSAIGPLLARELDALAPLADDPPRPFIAIVGGAQPRSKLPYVTALLETADHVLLSAPLAATFLAAGGWCGPQADAGLAGAAGDLLRRHGPAGSGRLLLPADYLTAGGRGLGPGSAPAVVRSPAPDRWLLDVGPETVRRYADTLAGAGSVLWNGALGEYHVEGCRAGTRAVVEALARSRAVGVVGGATTIIPIEELGLGERIGHVSTGGGSLLHLFAHRELPGLEAQPAQEVR